MARRQLINRARRAAQAERDQVKPSRKRAPAKKKAAKKKSTRKRKA